jgi:hypothetical protein
MGIVGSGLELDGGLFRAALRKPDVSGRPEVDERIARFVQPDSRATAVALDLADDTATGKTVAGARRGAARSVAEGGCEFIVEELAPLRPVLVGVGQDLFEDTLRAGSNEAAQQA